MRAALKDSQVSVRLPNELKEKMEAYAELTGRTKSFVAVEALSGYLDWRLPQIADLKAAVLAADSGDFASDDDVSAVLAKYTRQPKPRSTPKTKPKPTSRRRAA